MRSTLNPQLSTSSPRLEWTDHPCLPKPTRDQCVSWGAERTLDVWKQREEIILRERVDPFRYAYIPQTWKDADDLLKESILLAIFGGGGAAKTHYCIWRSIHTLVEKPGARVLFLHEAERSSIDTHQRFAYHYLPREWKPTEDYKMKKTLTTKVNYSIANGFTDNTFVLPNGSQGVFGSYKQDVKDYEGGGWSLVVADENLPLFWLLTLLFRLPRAGGKLLWPFTPIKGITPAVKHVIAGASTLRSRRAELLTEGHRVAEAQDWPPGEMPYIQKSIHPKAHAIYFFTQDNPFAGYADQKLLAENMSTEILERRFYGYARNSVRTLLPLFGAVHIIPPERVPAKLTRYHVIDPAGVRNIFMLWIGVDEHGRYFIHDEWPDVNTMGEWAVQSEDSNHWDGDPGPAQPTIGLSVVGYKKLILEREKGSAGVAPAGLGVSPNPIRIEERLIDSRSGRAEAIADDEGATTLIDRFEEVQTDKDGRVIGPSLEFVPAAGVHEREGIEAINNLLSYDPGQSVTAFINEPKLFISERCANLIWAMQNYTGHDGEKAACKDPIDCLRYAALAELEYVPEGGPRHGRVRSY